MDEQKFTGDAASVDTVEHTPIKETNMKKGKSVPLDSAGSEGTVEHLLIDNRTGIVKERRVSHNIMTDTGKAVRAGILSGDLAASFAPAYIYTGTSIVAASAADYALIAGVGNNVLGTKSRVTTTVTNDTYQVVATNSYASAYAITEAGLFSNAAPTTGCCCRNVFAALNVDSNTSIQTTWKIKMT